MNYRITFRQVTVKVVRGMIRYGDTVDLRRIL
jgi:hypothetical protein